MEDTEISKKPSKPNGQSQPSPFNQGTYCRYEPIEKRIVAVRVLVVDDLLRNDGDLSAFALLEWGRSTKTHLARERYIAGLALENITNNVIRLVQAPEIRVAHLSEVANAAAEFNPQAIVMSGTLRDFDYYNPVQLDSFCEFIHATKIPVLGICGAHQLIARCFGGKIVTLDNQEPSLRRLDRIVEYQYRFVRVLAPADPIFRGIAPQTKANDGSPDSYAEGRIVRVWQNHGLQADRVPDGFELLATSYLCRNQMMVKRSDDQLIYTVQFHLEKSFEDWNKNRTRWEHPNESRDGRIIFENFLTEAVHHIGSTVM